MREKSQYFYVKVFFFSNFLRGIEGRHLKAMLFTGGPVVVCVTE